MEKLLYAKQDLEKYPDVDINLLARSLGITEKNRNNKVWLIILKLHTGLRPERRFATGGRSQKARMSSIESKLEELGFDFDNEDFLIGCAFTSDMVDKLDFLPDYVKDALRNEKLYEADIPPQIIFGIRDNSPSMRIESYMNKDMQLQHEEELDEETMYSRLDQLRTVCRLYSAAGREYYPFGLTDEGKLLAAAKEGDLNKVQDLLAAGIDPNVRDIAEATPLMLAARRKHVPVFNALLAKGADPHLQDGYQYTALMWAIVAEPDEPGNLEMVQALLAKNVDPNVKNWNDQTALWLAASDGELPIVQALLDKGADPAVVATDGNTALMNAIKEGYSDIAKALLAGGNVNPAVANDEGNTALMMAQDPEIKKMIMDSFTYKTKGQVMNAMAQKKITRKDGMELIKILPVTLATKEEIAAAAECSPPPEYKVCANDKDLATNECWSVESPPELVLSFLDPKDPSRKPYTLCLRLEQFRKWVADPENEYRGWYPHADNQRAGKTLADIHSQGYGGSPSQVESFIKLPGEMNVYVSNTPQKLVQFPAGEYIGYPVYTQKRIGNVQGGFGMGMVHGQVPGETIYFLVPKTSDEQEKRSLLKREFLRMWVMKSARGTATPEKTIEEILARFAEIKDMVPKVDKKVSLVGLQEWLRGLGKEYTIPQLLKLTVLPLTYLGLTEIPAEIGELVALQELHLGKNKLTAIPAEIGKLRNLLVLALNSNQLTAIPAEIGKLSNLQELYLESNRLAAIPAEIGNLSDLRILDLSGNELTAIPMKLGQLTNLRRFDLLGNPLGENMPEAKFYGGSVQIHRALNIIRHAGYQ